MYNTYHIRKVLQKLACFTINLFTVDCMLTWFHPRQVCAHSAVGLCKNENEIPLLLLRYDSSSSSLEFPDTYQVNYDDSPMYKTKLNNVLKLITIRYPFHGADRFKQFIPGPGTPGTQGRLYPAKKPVQCSWPLCWCWERYTAAEQLFRVMFQPAAMLQCF